MSLNQTQFDALIIYIYDTITFKIMRKHRLEYTQGELDYAEIEESDSYDKLLEVLLKPLAEGKK